jgi:hypothetical protein
MTESFYAHSKDNEPPDDWQPLDKWGHEPKRGHVSEARSERYVSPEDKAFKRCGAGPFLR